MNVQMSAYQHMLGISDEDRIMYKLRYGDYMTYDEFAKEIGVARWDEEIAREVKG